MTDAPPIAIAGAGIAGLGASVALTLAGMKARTFERLPGLEIVGAGIQLGPTATRALKAWGVSLADAAFEPDLIELRAAQTGKVLNSIPLGTTFAARYGSPYLTMMRADLQTALLARARDLGCDIAFSAPVENVERHDGVLAVTAGGTAIEACALIGADGVHSAVRSAISGTREVDAHVTVWRAMLEPGSLPAPFRRHVTVWMAPGAHLVHYPVAGGARINAVLAIDGGEMALQDHGGPPQAVWKDWAPAARAAISSTDAWAPWRVKVVPQWKGGTRYIQTVGDAWHGMPPFLASGAVTALEDAFELASVFKEKEGRVIPSLEAFRARRAKRVWRIAAQSRQMGRIYHLPLPFAAARNLTIQSLSSQALLKRTDWLYGLKQAMPA